MGDGAAGEGAVRAGAGRNNAAGVQLGAAGVGAAEARGRASCTRPVTAADAARLLRRRARGVRGGGRAPPRKHGMFPKMSMFFKSVMFPKI